MSATCGQNTPRSTAVCCCTSSVVMTPCAACMLLCRGTARPFPSLHVHAPPDDYSALLQVLYFVEPIDEVAMQNVGEFAGKKLIDVSREGVDLGSDAEEAKKVSR